MSPVRASLRIYVTVYAALWAVALGVVTVQGHVLHKLYPYNTLLFYPNIHFTDFTIFDARFAAWDHTEKFFSLPGFPFTYPAPLLACFLAYWKLTPHPLAAYLLTVTAFAVGGAAWLGAHWPALRLPVATALIGSYPLMFLVDRANIEGLVWIAAGLGIFAFAKRRYATAAVLLGIATAMKIFPGALLLLFLAKRRYRDLAVGFLSAAVANIVALAIAGPDIPRALTGVLGGMNFFRHFEVLTYRADQIGFEHSLFSCAKQGIRLALRNAHGTDQMLPSLCLPYAVAVGAGFAALYWMRLRRLPILNQLFALTACSIVLPFVSYDYTLVHIYAPWAAFLIFLSRDVSRGRVAFSVSKALAVLLPCAVIFAPLSWILIRGTGCGGQIKALALLALIGAAAAIPMPSSLFGEVSAETHLSQSTGLITLRTGVLENKRAHSVS